MSNALSLLRRDFLPRFLLQCPPQGKSVLPVRQAAVLVALIDRTTPTLLLTKRSTALRNHPGQVAFPGGKRDPSDRTLIETALREAQEEVAMPPEAVQVLGTLPAVTSSTGFQVTPVVGIVPPGIHWQPNHDEVESVFEMPLTEALRLERYSALNVQRAGQRHAVWLSTFDDYVVWGMTAGIIRRLSLQTG